MRGRERSIMMWILLVMMVTPVTTSESVLCTSDTLEQTTELPQMTDVKVNWNASYTGLAPHTELSNNSSSVPDTVQPVPLVSVNFSTGLEVENVIWWVSVEGEENDLVITNKTPGDIQQTMTRSGHHYNFKLFTNQTLSSARIVLILWSDCVRVTRNVLFTVYKSWRTRKEDRPTLVLTAPSATPRLPTNGTVRVLMNTSSQYFRRFMPRIVSHRQNNTLHGPDRAYRNYLDNFYEAVVPFDIIHNNQTVNGEYKSIEATLQVPADISDMTLDFILVGNGGWGDNIDRDWMNYIIQYHTDVPAPPRHRLYPCYRGLTRVRSGSDVDVVQVTDYFMVCFYVQVNGNPLPDFKLNVAGEEREWLSGTVANPRSVSEARRLYFWRMLGRDERVELTLVVDGPQGYTHRVRLESMRRHEVIDLRTHQ